MSMRPFAPVNAGLYSDLLIESKGNTNLQRIELRAHIFLEEPVHIVGCVQLEALVSQPYGRTIPEHVEAVVVLLLDLFLATVEVYQLGL